MSTAHCERTVRWMNILTIHLQGKFKMNLIPGWKKIKVRGNPFTGMIFSTGRVLSIQYMLQTIRTNHLYPYRKVVPLVSSLLMPINFTSFSANGGSAWMTTKFRRLSYGLIVICWLSTGGSKWSEVSRNGSVTWGEINIRHFNFSQLEQVFFNLPLSPTENKQLYFAPTMFILSIQLGKNNNSYHVFHCECHIALPCEILGLRWQSASSKPVWPLPAERKDVLVLKPEVKKSLCHKNF